MFKLDLSHETDDRWVLLFFLLFEAQTTKRTNMKVHNIILDIDQINRLSYIHETLTAAQSQYTQEDRPS